MHAWTAGRPLRLPVLTQDDGEPGPIAVCCYGLLRRDSHKVMLRFVEGRPTGDLTIGFIDWVCRELHKEGKRRLIIVWDDASWHAAKAFVERRGEHNRRVRRAGGTEVLHCELPVGSP